MVFNRNPKGSEPRSIITFAAQPLIDCVDTVSARGHQVDAYGLV